MKINKSHPLRGLLLATMLIPVFSCAAMLHAQSTNAVVTGFVTDASGAKLPGATVTYRNVDTGVSSTTTTNAEGLYLVPNLLPGTYQATIKMLGFKEAVNQGLNLHVEDQVALNYSLSIGETSETVTVTADENVLETSSPTVSQVIEGRQVEETPLNGPERNEPGGANAGCRTSRRNSAQSSNKSLGGATSNANSFGNYQIAGGLSAESGVYIDGAPVNGEFHNAVAHIIAQDAIQEFRVESRVVNPQHGRFGGGAMEACSPRIRSLSLLRFF